MLRRRIAAASALLTGLATIGLAIALAVAIFPRGLLSLAAFVLALGAAVWAIVHRETPRYIGLSAAVLLAAAGTVLLVAREPLLVALTLAALWLTLVLARTAFRVHVPLPHAPRPHYPVLFYNPRSGDGKAARFHLPEEARARGIEPIELTPGTDLELLVRDAVAHGADGLAMAGGDGSQAVVARIAAELHLPYACIPAGTRNHFALDLGVDREDVVGALDAFVDGGERIVDLGEVNGHVFVNNVSLGLYAEAVERPGYREAKLRTLLDTVPDVIGPAATGLALTWHGPDGDPHRSGAVILVSNNQYRLGHALGSGTRPRIDDGLLGVTVLGARARPGERGAMRAWGTAAFDVDADDPVPTGIDGETRALDPPLHFRIHPAALRCRIARAHPGASPSAFEPDNPWAAVTALAGIAAGRDPRPVPGAAPQPPATARAAEAEQATAGPAG